jgi:hypothetical protein
MKAKKKVIKHLKDDIETFKHEAAEDKKLIKSLAKKKKPAKKKMSKGKKKIKRVMHEFKEHELHSGSKKGPLVKNPKQAIAIALSESRKVSKKKK